jgi:hypothetical protein
VEEIVMSDEKGSGFAKKLKKDLVSVIILI